MALTEGERLDPIVRQAARAHAITCRTEPITGWPLRWRIDLCDVGEAVLETTGTGCWELNLPFGEAVTSVVDFAYTPDEEPDCLDELFRVAALRRAGGHPIMVSHGLRRWLPSREGLLLDDGTILGDGWAYRRYPEAT